MRIAASALLACDSVNCNMTEVVNTVPGEPVRIYDSVIVSHVDTYRSNTNCAPAPQPEVHDYILMRCLSTSMHCLMYRLGLQTRVSNTLLYIRLEFLRANLGYTRRCPWPRPPGLCRPSSQLISRSPSLSLAIAGTSGTLQTLTTRQVHQKLSTYCLSFCHTPLYQQYPYLRVGSECTSLSHDLFKRVVISVIELWSRSGIR